MEQRVLGLSGCRFTTIAAAILFGLLAAYEARGSLECLFVLFLLIVIVQDAFWSMYVVDLAYAPHVHLNPRDTPPIYAVCYHNPFRGVGTR